MFNKGDRVKIVNNGGKSSYNTAVNRTGTIEQIREYDKYDTVYYVKLDANIINPNNAMNSWCCTADMLGDPNINFGVCRTTYTTTEIDDIIKENKMEILEIYYERKRKQLNINQEKEINKIKMKDEKYARFMELRKELEEFEKENTISFRIDYAQFKFSNEITEMGEKCNNKYHTKNKELEQLINEVKSQLSMCETYEQKQNVLRNYEIIDEKGKINA